MAHGMITYLRASLAAELNQERYRSWMAPRFLFWRCLVLALVTIFAGVKSVPQGREWTVERFGRFTRVLKPGLNLIVPYVDRVGRKLSMMEEVLDIPSQVVITRDNATVTADAIAFYQVVDAAKAAYEVANLQAGITNLCLTNARTVIGAMDLDEVLSKRDEINQRLLRVVDQATSPWGVKVTRIEIKDLSPPTDITEAMARQMKAERFRRAEVTQADGEKQGAILRAEGAKQSAILQAEGRKEAAFRDAEARERWRRRKRRRRRWCRTRSKRATSTRSTTSSVRNMSKRSRSLPTRPTRNSSSFRWSRRACSVRSPASPR